MSRCFSAWLVSLGVLACVGTWAAPSAAHIALTYPPPRSMDQNSQKENPCGGAAATEPTEFEAGSTITVEWEDQISHPGWYVISFDPDGDDFDGDGDGTGDFPAQSTDTTGMYSNGNGDLVLLDNLDPVPYNGTRMAGMHSADVTLPSEPCDSCTLQLIQVMDDAQHSPTSRPDNTGHIYFRCADIRLVAPSGSGGANAGGSAATAGSGGSGTSAGMGGTPDQSMGGMPSGGMASGGMAGNPPMMPSGGMASGGTPQVMPMTPEPAVTPAPDTPVPDSTPTMTPTGTPATPPAPDSPGAPTPVTPAPAMTDGTTGAATPTGTDMALDSNAGSGSSGDDGGCAIAGPGRHTGTGWLALVAALGVAISLGRRRR